MEIGHILAFNIALFAAIASPGPALLYSVRTTLSGGRAAGLAAGLGLAVMASLWTLTALLGLDGLFYLFPWAYMAFKVIGTLYLFIVAWQTWRQAAKPINQSDKPHSQAFVGGLLMNLANPKPVLDRVAALILGALGLRLMLDQK